MHHRFRLATLPRPFKGINVRFHVRRLYFLLSLIQAAFRFSAFLDLLASQFFYLHDMMFAKSFASLALLTSLCVPCKLRLPSAHHDRILTVW